MVSSVSSNTRTASFAGSFLPSSCSMVAFGCASSLSRKDSSWRLFSIRVFSMASRPVVASSIVPSVRSVPQLPPLSATRKANLLKRLQDLIYHPTAGHDVEILVGELAGRLAGGQHQVDGVSGL